MPYFLLQVAYTSESVAGLIKNPQNRGEAVRPAVEKLGGRVVDSWVSFGDYDVVAILEFPANANAAALAMIFGAGGGVRAVKTTPLLTWDEAMEGMRMAGGSPYRPAAQS